MEISELETTTYSSDCCFGDACRDRAPFACSAAVAAAAAADAAAGAVSALPLPLGLLPAPEELLARVDWEVGCEKDRAVACNATNTAIVELTWFYDESVLEAVGDQTHPLRRLSFEVRQQTEVANGRLRTRVHPCDCHSALGADGCASVGEVQEQRFRMPGCQAGRNYLLSVRARAVFDSSVNPVFSPYTDTITIFVPQRFADTSSLPSSLSSTWASGVGCGDRASPVFTATAPAVAPTATISVSGLDGVGFDDSAGAFALIREDLSAVVDDTPSIHARPSALTERPQSQQEQKQPLQQVQVCQQTHATMPAGGLEVTWQPGTLEPMQRHIALVPNAALPGSLGFDDNGPSVATVEADENGVAEALPPSFDALAVTVAKPLPASRGDELPSKGCEPLHGSIPIRESSEKEEDIENDEADVLTTSHTPAPADAAAALDAASSGTFGEASRARVSSFLGKQVANALMAAQRVKQEEMECASLKGTPTQEQTSPACSVSPCASNPRQAGFATAFASYCDEQIVGIAGGPLRHPRAAPASAELPPRLLSEEEPGDVTSSVAVDVGTPKHGFASSAAVAITAVTRATGSPRSTPSARDSVITEHSGMRSSRGDLSMDASIIPADGDTQLGDAANIAFPIEETKVQPSGNMNRWMSRILAGDSAPLVAPKQPRLTPREDDVRRQSLEVAAAVEAAEIEEAAAEAAAAVSAMAQPVSDAARSDGNSVVLVSRHRHGDSACSSRTVSPEPCHKPEMIATATAGKQVAEGSAGLVPRTQTTFFAAVTPSPPEATANLNVARRDSLTSTPRNVVIDTPSISQSFTQLAPTRPPNAATTAMTTGHPQQLYESREISYYLEREQPSFAPIVSSTVMPPRGSQATGTGAGSVSFAVGDAVHIWSNSNGTWMTDGTITEVRTTPWISDGLSLPAGHVAPAGSVKVSSSAGLKWILPEVISTQLRRACPVKKPSIGGTSGILTAGEAVHVWSKSQQTWLTDGRICEVSDGSNSFFNGFPVRAGAVRVVSSAGEKWVMQEQIDAHIRRLAAPAVGAETVVGVAPLPAAAMETCIPKASSTPSFQKHHALQYKDLPVVTPAVPTQQPKLIPSPKSTSVPSSRDDLGPTVLELPKRAAMPSFPSQGRQQQSTPQLWTGAGGGVDGLGPTRMLPSASLGPGATAGPASAAIRRLSSVAEAEPFSASHRSDAAVPMMSPMPKSSSFSYSMPKNPQVVSSSAPCRSCAAAVSGGGAAVGSVVAGQLESADEKPLDMSQRLAQANDYQRRLGGGGGGLAYQATSPSFPMTAAAPSSAPTASFNGVSVDVGSFGGVCGLGCGTIDYMPPPQRTVAKKSDDFGSAANASGVGCGTINVLPTLGVRAAVPVKNEAHVQAAGFNVVAMSKSACGCGTVGALPPPPRGAPAAKRTTWDVGMPPSSSFNVGGSCADSEGRHILQVLVSDGRWEELCFCQRDNMDEVSSAFLRCHGLKAAFGPSLVVEMRRMMAAGQAENSVDIIDLL